MKAALMFLMLGTSLALSSGLYVRRGQDPPKLPSESDIDNMSIGDSLNAIMNVVQHMKAISTMYRLRVSVYQLSYYRMTYCEIELCSSDFMLN